MFFGHAAPAPAAPDAADDLVAAVAAMIMGEDAAVEAAEDAEAAAALAALIAAAAAAAEEEPWPTEPAPMTPEEWAAYNEFFETHPWPPLEELGLGAAANEN
jgi:hypothetical protein